MRNAVPITAPIPGEEPASGGFSTRRSASTSPFPRSISSDGGSGDRELDEDTEPSRILRNFRPCCDSPAIESSSADSSVTIDSPAGHSRSNATLRPSTVATPMSCPLSRRRIDGWGSSAGA